MVLLSCLYSHDIWPISILVFEKSQKSYQLGLHYVKMWQYIKVFASN